VARGGSFSLRQGVGIRKDGSLFHTEGPVTDLTFAHRIMRERGITVSAPVVPVEIVSRGSSQLYHTEAAAWQWSLCACAIDRLGQCGHGHGLPAGSAQIVRYPKGATAAQTGPRSHSWRGPAPHTPPRLTYPAILHHPGIPRWKITSQTPMGLSDSTNAPSTGLPGPGLEQGSDDTWPGGR
jgi:hypothetical protein